MTSSKSEDPIENSFTPREVVSELDRYIVGQEAAKKAVAIALRNRWRRRRVPEELRDEISPKNIILIDPPVSARRKSPDAWPVWHWHRLLKLRPRSLPRSDTSVVMSIQ